MVLWQVVLLALYGLVAGVLFIALYREARKEGRRIFIVLMVIVALIWPIWAAGYFVDKFHSWWNKNATVA